MHGRPLHLQAKDDAWGPGGLSWERDEVRASITIGWMDLSRGYPQVYHLKLTPPFPKGHR